MAPSSLQEQYPTSFLLFSLLSSETPSRFLSLKPFSSRHSFPFGSFFSLNFSSTLSVLCSQPSPLLSFSVVLSTNPLKPMQFFPRPLLIFLAPCFSFASGLSSALAWFRLPLGSLSISHYISPLSPHQKNPPNPLISWPFIGTRNLSQNLASMVHLLRFSFADFQAIGWLLLLKTLRCRMKARWPCTISIRWSKTEERKKNQPEKLENSAAFPLPCFFWAFKNLFFF